MLTRSILPFTVMAFAALSSAQAFGPTVETPLGVIRGSHGRHDTFVWKGIPYAQPPVEQLRWRSPRPVEPWTGVLRATSFASPALQYSPALHSVIIGSEDCLYLNIWRPDSPETGLPVFVWIHGGGNSIGSANQVRDWHGDVLAARGRVVFVSLNYRLGPFGWFLHPSFSSDLPATSAADNGDGRDIDAEDSSGNYGTLDIIEALRWVRDNIAAFGGDPNRVTIAGESAGAMNVLSLLLAPAAEGLFSRAVVESGTPRINPRSAGEAIGMQVQNALDARVDIRDALADVSGRDIMRLFQPQGFGMLGLPNIFADGYVLPVAGYEALARGDYPSRVPVLIGSNQDEMKLFLAGDRKLRRDPAVYDAVTRALSDRWKADGVDAIARKLRATPEQPSIYAYHFRWGARDEEGNSELPGRKGLWYGAFHSLEIPFFLGTGTIHGPLTPRFFRPSNAKGRERLTDAMLSYLVSFIRTGDPNAEAAGLPDWEPWSNKAGAAKSLILDYRAGGLDVRMMNEEYTAAGIRAAVIERYPKTVADSVVGRLDSWAAPGQ